MQTETLNLAGSASAESVAEITRVLANVDGVKTVRVSYEDQVAVVEFDEQQTAALSLYSALSRAGFGPEPKEKVKEVEKTCCGGCCR